MKRAIPFILALMLCGCVSTPESVKNNSAENKEPNKTSTIETISISELSNDIDKALSYTYSQFTLGDGVNVEIPDKFAELSFTQIADYEKDYEKIFLRYFDKLTLEKADITNDTGYDGMVSYSFNDPLEKINSTVGNNGFICFVKPSAYDNLFHGGKRVKVYHIDRNDDLSDSYKLDGTDVSVSQARDFAQKWLDENYADLEPDYKISVKTIIARQNEQGVNSYDIFAEKSYNGIMLDNLVQLADEENNAKMKYVTQSIYMQMFKVDEIGSMTNGNGMIIPKEISQLDKIVSLSSAMGYIENTFTDFNSKVEISDINLKYTLTPLNDFTTDPPQSCSDAGLDFDSRLVWEFVIDVPENELPTGEEYSSIGDMKKFIYVDAENGELEYEFDTNVLFQ